VAYALLFPGQASQQVGMGADVRRLSSTAAAIFDAADAATGLPLSSVIADGPLARLTETQFAQPAVVATSLATLAVLRERLGDRLAPAFCAGHSVGELAALAAAGAVDAQTAVRLVARRSALMADACARVDGTMAAVLGLDEQALQALCAEASQATGTTVQLANLNSSDQLVVSGHTEAVGWLEREGRDRGARRVIRLPVGGPFHSEYMRPAAEGFAAELRDVQLQAPRTPIVLNQTARPTTDPAEIRRELGEQIAAPVRWADSLQTMSRAGCTLFLEVGPGQVLAGLVRRNLPEARTISVNDQAGLELAVAALAERAAGE
jgi:[acyl-carrier-protein] S-malonyltransferase